MVKKLKVIVVDDSALMRKIISDMINSNNDMEVVATARNGQELMNKLESYVPDVITLDVEMPVMDGITTLKKLKEKKNHPKVIMVSSLTGEDSKITLECLDLGAFDFIMKPSGSISLDIEKIKEELVRKIRSVEKANNKFFVRMTKANSIEEPKYNKVISKRNDIKAVVIGASTGGPRALQKVLTKLPKDLGVPVFVVQHMPVGFTKAFAERLNSLCAMRVVEAEDRMAVSNNIIYIAKGGRHMKISNSKEIRLTDEDAIWGVKPAVDKLFYSAAEIYGGKLLSVILTGMGRDGALGTTEIKKAGGSTIAEDASTCVIYGMPKAAYETGKVDEVVALDKIPERIVEIVRGR